MPRRLLIPPSAALTQMRLEDAERGELEEPASPMPADPPPPPPEPLEIPPPDWRAEELERAQPTATEDNTPPKPTYPARKQPSRKSKTPNLDKAKAIREELR
jgi:hypothetical protein